MNRSCAFHKCDDPHCYFCVVMPVKFAIVPCPRMSEIDGEPCRFVAGHPGPCKPAGSAKRQQALRDGTAKTKRRDPTFVPRRRVGPQR